MVIFPRLPAQEWFCDVGVPRASLHSLFVWGRSEVQCKCTRAVFGCQRPASPANLPGQLRGREILPKEPGSMQKRKKAPRSVLSGRKCAILEKKICISPHAPQSVAQEKKRGRLGSSGSRAGKDRSTTFGLNVIFSAPDSSCNWLGYLKKEPACGVATEVQWGATALGDQL